MGLFRPRKETSGSMDLTEQGREASRSRFSFHRRARDESTSRMTLGSPSEARPLTQRVLRASPQSKDEEAPDIRPAPQSGLLLKSRSDNDETGNKEEPPHRFINKRSEPAISHMSRSKSPLQVSDRRKKAAANSDPDPTSPPSSSLSHTEPKTPVSSASSTESSPNTTPSPVQKSVIKAKIYPRRSPQSPVTVHLPTKDEKPEKRQPGETKKATLRPIITTPLSEQPPPPTSSVKSPEPSTTDTPPIEPANASVPRPILLNDCSEKKEQRRIIPVKSVSHSPTSTGGSPQNAATEERPLTPPASPSAHSSTASHGTSATGGGILKRSAMKAPAHPDPKIASSPAVSSSVPAKTEEPSAAPNSEALDVEQNADTELIAPSSPHTNASKTSSSSSHIRRISLNESDRPSPKAAAARKATFAPSALRTQALRSPQQEGAAQLPTPSRSKPASSNPSTSEHVFDFSPSDSSSTQATPTDEGTVSSDPPALSKILKSSYAFDADRRGNLGSPFACPGFDNEGSANELLKALTMRRMKTIKMEKSWAGVGAQDDDSEEELPTSRVKIIPRKGQL